MYNSQEIAERIKSTAKSKGLPLKTVLSDCGLGVNAVSQMAKGKDMLTKNMANIADHLDCSVDYLLGRTEEPSILHNSVPQSFTQKEIDLIIAYRQAEQNDRSIVDLALDKYIQTEQEKTVSAG